VAADEQPLHLDSLLTEGANPGGIERRRNPGGIERRRSFGGIEPRRNPGGTERWRSFGGIERRRSFGTWQGITSGEKASRRCVPGEPLQGDHVHRPVARSGPAHVRNRRPGRALADTRRSRQVCRGRTRAVSGARSGSDFAGRLVLTAQS
jgi:hypothetical protein